MKSLDVNIIGAGIGGLAAAIRLASRGHRVKVFEKEKVAGGKMGQLSWQGYRWDTGPSLFTLPELVDELYALAGRENGEGIAYEKLEVICRYFYSDGTVVDAHSDPENFARELHEKLGEKPQDILDHLEHSRRIYDLTSEVFIFSSFTDARTFISPEFLRALLQVHTLRPLKTMHRVNHAALKDERSVQLFDRYATYNGSDPYRAPGTLNVIAHLEHNMGAFFPKEGMRSIARGLFELASGLGVEFHFDRAVDGIRMNGRRPVGLLSGGVFHGSDLVVSDMDVHLFYRDVAPALKPPRRKLTKEPSTSALIFYWAMDRKFENLDLHNIFFASDYRDEFRCLKEGRQIYHDPTVYVFISSKKVVADAPGEGENWFVMINTPPDAGQDWKAMVATARIAIQDKLGRMLGEKIEDHIIHEQVLDPPGIESYTSSRGGALYGNASNSSLAAFGRHPNYRSAYPGLYFVGGSVHPGGGIPLCLASARIVDNHIQKHYGKD